MISLLEQSDKELIKKEHRKRYAVLFLSMTAFALAGVLVGVASIYARLLIEEQALDGSLAILQGGRAGEATAFLAEVKRTNDLLKKIAGDKAGLRALTPVLEEIGKAKPAGIQVLSINVEKNGDAYTVKLKGRSAWRKNMLDFSENLKKSALIAGVDSPFSNLIKEKNSDFSISLMLATSTANKNES